ncbi:MAG: hypothetical protein ACLQVY_19585 [Limisphaerales bacterium]
MPASAIAAEQSFDFTHFQLRLGHHTNAGRGPRRWNAAPRRRYDQAPAKLQALATQEISG